MRSRFVLLALALGATTPMRAQRTTYAPLSAQLPTGARAVSLGGMTAASRDPEAALGNPALAGSFTGTGLSLVNYHDGANGGVIGVSTAVGVIGVGFAVSYLDYAPTFSGIGQSRLSDDVLWRPGAGTAASLAGAFSLSTAFKGLRWGAAATYLEERIEAERASVAALNVGASKDAVFANMTLGVALQNIGPSLSFGPASDIDLPTRLAVGLSGAFFPLNAWLDLGASGGVAVRRDGFVSGSVGGELTYVPIEGVSFALRTGVRRAELKAQRPLTAGLGFALDRFALDYAWEQLREGGAHRVGLRIR
ncbi:MAG: hypothetical protein ACT4P7_18115 [Gemmatimonadaceae bacterium]